MIQWTAQTKKKVETNVITASTYTAKMKAAGGFDAYVKSLGGVFAKWHGVTTKVKTVAEFQERVEYVQGLMAIFRFCYFNGSTWWYWQNSSAASFYKSKQTKTCPSGTIRQLCTGEGGRTRITNCNYGVDTMSRALGCPIWSAGYSDMIVKGAKKVTDKSKLQVGDLVHFFNGATVKKNWRHVAIVYSVDNGEIVLADFGKRFITTGNPHHLFPSEYSNYGSSWFGVHWLDLADDEGDKFMIKNTGFRGFNVSHRTEKPAYIVIHYTGAEGTAAQNVLYFNAANRNASADVFVGHNGELLAYNNDIAGQYTWHCGGSVESAYHPYLNKCNNANSIGIELCTRMVNGQWTFTDKTVDAAVAVTRHLMERFGIDANHVIRHYDVTGKSCPRVPGWGAVGGDAAWKAFKDRLTDKEVIPVPRTIKIGSTGKLVRMLQEFLGGLKVDGKFGAKTKAAVIKWQKNHKLTQDGVVGPKTWRAILESLQ